MQAVSYADIGGAESREQQILATAQLRLEHLHRLFQPSAFQFGNDRRAIRRRDEEALLDERGRMHRHGFTVVNPLKPLIPLGVPPEPAETGRRIALAQILS